MWRKFWETVLGEVGASFRDYQTTKRQDRELRAKQHERRMKQEGDDKQAATSSDTYFLNNAGGKRDISFAVVMLPIPLAFYPPMVEHIMAGFAALELMPTWYKIAAGSIMVSIWGLRRLALAYFQARLVHKSTK